MVYIKIYIFSPFYYQYLVLLTMVPRNRSMRTACHYTVRSMVSVIDLHMYTGSVIALHRCCHAPHLLLLLLILLQLYFRATSFTSRNETMRFCEGSAYGSPYRALIMNCCRRCYVVNTRHIGGIIKNHDGQKKREPPIYSHIIRSI